MFFKNNRLGLIWTLVIFSICVVPGNNISGTSFLNEFGLDKIIHAFVYFVLINFVAKGLVRTYGFSISKGLLIAFFYCLLLGVAIEFIQSFFVEGRTGDLYDVIANNFGAILGGVIFVKSNQQKKVGS